MLSLAALLIGPGPAAAQSQGEVRTAATEHRSGERLKTIPISKKAWQKPRSVLSLSPNQVGRITAGDRIEAATDVEFSVCLKPNPRHRSKGRPCNGRIYGFDPKLRLRLVLAPKADSAGPGRTMPLSNIASSVCTQKQPDRNHHCVLQIPWSGINVPDPSALPCESGACRINVVASAFHGKAKRRQKVVVGSANEQGKIKQGKAKLSSVLYRGGKGAPDKVEQTAKRARGKFSIAAKGAPRKRYVAVSIPVRDLRAGDQLVVDSRLVTNIGHLPYNAFQRTEILLADGPGKTEPKQSRHANKVAESTTRIGADNGFNCTQGSSGHRTPCAVRKTGVVSIKRGSSEPLYVNLVVAQSAQGIAPLRDRWRSGHRAKVAKRGNFIRVERRRGTSSCASCATGSGVRFDPDREPKGAKQRKLVKQLARFGITQGTLSCTRRSGRPLVCRWASAGRYNESRTYECSSKSTWRKKKRRWTVKACGDALGAQVWDILQRRELHPTFAGACEKREGVQIYICKWYAGIERVYFCKGGARYDASKRNWSVGPCRL